MSDDPFTEDITNHYAALDRKARGRNWVVRGTVIYDEHGHEVARCQKHDEAKLIAEYRNVFPVALEQIATLRARVRHFAHQAGRFRLIARVFHIYVPQGVIDGFVPLLTAEEGTRLHQSRKTKVHTRHRKANGEWKYVRAAWDAEPPFSREEADAIMERAIRVAAGRDGTVRDDA